MDHDILDAENVAERYVTGRLSSAEAARFEEHYLDCPQCCARIEAAERLGRGLARVAAEADRRPASRSRPTPAWGLAAAALLTVALLPAGWAFREVGLLSADLKTTGAALALARAAEAGKPPVALETELRKTRSDLAALARELAGSRKPLLNLPILALAPLRGGSGDGPVRTLTLPREPGWVALWVEPGDEYPAYRVTLTDARGTAVFTAPRLAQNDLGALFVAVHSTSLPPGDYRLAVDGLGGRAGDAPTAPVARFPVRVVAPGRAKEFLVSPAPSLH